MSKYTDRFVNQYKNLGTVKRLTKEIKDATDKNKSQKEIDRVISQVLKGKYVRRLK